MSEILRAGIYQYRCRDEAPIERLKRLDEMLASHDGELDLVVCPELFLSGYNVGERVRQFAEPQTGGFREAASALARRRRTALVYGYPELRRRCGLQCRDLHRRRGQDNRPPQEAAAPERFRAVEFLHRRCLHVLPL